MIRLPVISVLEEGLIECFTLSTEDRSGEGPDVCVRGTTFSEGTVQQLKLARAIAQRFLNRPYVQPLAVDTLEHSTVVVESNGGAAYEGPSFGLAFLAGCLAVGLGVPLRQNQMYTAALVDGCEITGMPGGGIRLGPVGSIGPKLASACRANQSRLYLRSEDEHAILKFEQGFWSGDVERVCRPYVLPEHISTAAVAAMSLDPRELIQRAIVTPESTALLLLMFAVGGELYDGASLMEGLGACLAGLRGKGRLRDVAFLDQLLREYGIRANCPAEHLLLYCFDRTVAACSVDSARADVVKAIISDDPQRPLFDVSDHARGDQTLPDGADLDAWLDRNHFDDPQKFLSAPQILRVCSQLAPDFEGYWPKVKKLLHESLSAYLARVVHFSVAGHQSQAQQLLSMLSRSAFVDSIGRLNPQLVGEAKSLVAMRVAQLEAAGQDKLAQVAAGVHAELARRQVPEVLADVVARPQPKLKFTFGVVGRQGPLQADAKRGFVPRPPLNRINDLELLITGPAQLSLFIPSPVLLIEHCRTQHYGYCRRRDMTVAEDTLNHYPEVDGEIVRNLFAGHNCTVIGFQVCQDMGAAPGSIRWLSWINPWPPAIDSQFLAACIAQSTARETPRRLLDVGCGTGYLALIAAHRWPSLRELHLVDIDALAVAVARANMQDDPIAGQIDVATYWRGFNRFQGEGFDVLLCAPPYLPERPLPASGIEVSTNGTALLEEVVTRGCALSKEVWMAFSALAWPEFQRALARVPKAYQSIDVLRREFVPFRIGWLEPRSQEEGGDIGLFNARRDYYEKVLLQRGLLDMDGHDDWGNYLQEFSPQIPPGCSADLCGCLQTDPIEKTLDTVKEDSRGYRFWHEVRVLRMKSA